MIEPGASGSELGTVIIMTACVELGVRVHAEPALKPWGARLAAVYDPDGNLLGLHQR